MVFWPSASTAVLNCEWEALEAVSACVGWSLQQRAVSLDPSSLFLVGGLILGQFCCCGCGGLLGFCCGWYSRGKYEELKRQPVLPAIARAQSERDSSEARSDGPPASASRESSRSSPPLRRHGLPEVRGRGSVARKTAIGGGGVFGHELDHRDA